LNRYKVRISKKAALSEMKFYIFAMLAIVAFCYIFNIRYGSVAFYIFLAFTVFLSYFLAHGIRKLFLFYTSSEIIISEEGIEFTNDRLYKWLNIENYSLNCLNHHYADKKGEIEIDEFILHIDLKDSTSLDKNLSIKELDTTPNEIISVMNKYSGSSIGSDQQKKSSTG